MRRFTGLRSLINVPGFALTVLLTLGLGTGALITAFTLVDAALWRSPPFRDASRIVLLYRTRVSPDAPLQRERWPYAGIKLLRAQAAGTITVANYTAISLALTGGDEPEWVSGEVVSPEYFGVMGASAILGRTIAPSDDVETDARAVVVLSYDLWQRRFAGEAGAFGKTVYMRGLPVTVIGVAPQGFRGLTDKAQFWIPTALAPVVSYPEYLTTNQNFISTVGKLEPGVTLAQAQSALNVIGTRIARTIPDEDPDPTATLSATAVQLNEARAERTTRRSLLILLSAVVVLYLLACANAVNLLLGRAAARRREAAILTALGAEPRRLLTHFLPEAILAVLCSSVLGLFLAWIATQYVTPPTEVWGPRNFYGSIGVFADAHFGVRAFAFAAALTLITLLLVGWAPLASTTRLEVASALRQGDRGAAARAGTLRRPTLRNGVVALEVALAMLLLVGGALLMESFLRMRGTDLGVDRERVLTFWIRPSESQVPTSAAPAFVTRVLEAVESVPGVIAATVDGGAPAAGSARTTLHIPGRPTGPGKDEPVVLRHYIAPDHFKVLGVKLLRGRVFDDNDTADRPPVAIISESAARRFWPDDEAIGKRVFFGGSAFTSPDSTVEIVGIVADVVHEPLDVGRNRNDFYTPYRQFTYGSRQVMVRTAGEPMAAFGAIRSAIRRVDANLPLVDVKQLSALIGSSWSRQRFDAALFSGFAVVALLLALSGIYAVVSFAVSQRTRELGIRMALGARPGAIVKLVLRDGMAFPVIGLLAGIVSAFLLTRFLRAALYEVAPTDPHVFASTAAVLAGVSLLGCLLPAWRAARQDPLGSLRTE